MENILPLRLLVLVAKMGSFSAAGRAMGLSPPSVLRYMNQLEDEVGASLFLRSSRKVTVTRLGEAYLERAKVIIHDIDQFKSNILEMSADVQGVLHVHTRIATGTLLIVPILAEFRRKYPGLQLQLTFSDAEIDLVDNNVDISIVTKLPAASSHVSRRLLSCPRVVSASPDYLEKRPPPATPQDLRNHDCIVWQYDLGDPTWRFRQGATVQKIKPNAVVRTTDGFSMMSLALQGAGIVMLPRFFLTQDLEAGRLIQVLGKYESCPTGSGSFQFSTWALYPKSRHPSVKMRAFLDLLIDSIRRRSHSEWSEK